MNNPSLVNSFKYLNVSPNKKIKFSSYILNINYFGEFELIKLRKTFRNLKTRDIVKISLCRRRATINELLLNNRKIK